MSNWKESWWRILCVALLFYTLFGGLLMEVPRKPILNESIRNLYFHVPMWFAMIALLGASFWHSILFLRKNLLKHDIIAKEATNSGILFGILGLASGAVWARYTWGEFWSGDPKQNASAIGLLIYVAYVVLRNAISDDQQRAKVAAVFNIFAFSLFIPLIFVLPRLTDSLHPGNGGNPGFNAYDLDSQMRLVFYPAVIGWILVGWWLTTQRIRLEKIKLARIYA